MKTQVLTDTGISIYDQEIKKYIENQGVGTTVESSSINGNIKVNGTETTVYVHPNGTNPHGTTKSDVGLGNVPNVTTNDQIPSYTEATSLVKLTSGEKLSIAFGKISKAITDFISHVGDSVKHITSTERTNWNAAKTHADSSHAPSDAQVNVIETVKVNGTALTPSSKAVDITVPSVGNGTITITQNGTTKGTFTTNQSGNTTIALTDDNTTYGVATQSANGLESAADKKKLDGIATGAEVNQNAFSNIVVGSTTVAADSKTDTLTIVAGSNVTIIPDATNDKITISSKDTTYGEVSSTANGLMTSALYNKLNNLDTNQLSTYAFNSTLLYSYWNYADYYDYSNNTVLGSLSSSSSSFSVPAHTTRYIKLNITSDISKSNFPVISWYGTYTILGIDVYSTWVSSSKVIYIYITNNGTSAQNFQLSAINFVLASGYTNITGTHTFEVKDDGHLYVTY